MPEAPISAACYYSISVESDSDSDSDSDSLMDTAEYDRMFSMSREWHLHVRAT